MHLFLVVLYAECKVLFDASFSPALHNSLSCGFILLYLHVITDEVGVCLAKHQRRVFFGDKNISPFQSFVVNN